MAKVIHVVLFVVCLMLGLVHISTTSPISRSLLRTYLDNNCTFPDYSFMTDVLHVSHFSSCKQDPELCALLLKAQEALCLVTFNSSHTRQIYKDTTEDTLCEGLKEKLQNVHKCKELCAEEKLVCKALFLYVYVGDSKF